MCDGGGHSRNPAAVLFLGLHTVNPSPAVSVTRISGCRGVDSHCTGRPVPHIVGAPDDSSADLLPNSPLSAAHTPAWRVHSL